MRRAIALLAVLILVCSGAIDARPGGGGGRAGGGARGGGGGMSRPSGGGGMSRPSGGAGMSRPSGVAGASRPVAPPGGFGGFNGDFAGRQPVNRPGAGREPGTGIPPGSQRPPGSRPPPGTRPPGTRPPGARPIPPPVPPPPAWGWNGGVVWAPAPYYYGGGFWGPYAWGATTAIVLGAVVDESSHEEVQSYQVAPDSPGAKVLQAYHLQQVPCKNDGVVVIYGPQESVVCATPNDVLAAGVYDLNVDDLTIYSRT